ncbi:hypothetical protein OAL54_10875 [Gammaproteobacteria bacterium]|nr:hypothetical protein [Gammaproteobacteria bacterium]
MNTKKGNNDEGIFTLVTTHLLHTYYTLVKTTSQTLIDTGILVMSTIEWE